MQTPTPPVDVEQIMHEIRAGLSDTTLTQQTQAAAAALASLRTDLDTMAATAPLLGRCGGSIRGKLCRAISPAALPVTEQINLFHLATLDTLSHIADSIDQLEARIRAIEQASQTGANR